MEANKQILKARRDYLLPALRELGFVINSQPAGAFYIYADASHFTQDAQELCLQLLEQTGVALTPALISVSLKRIPKSVLLIRRVLSV